MTQAEYDDRRRYLRYPPDESEIVLLQFSNTTPSEELFEPETAGLVCEESRGGLRIVVLTRGPIRSVEKGSRCVVQVANRVYPVTHLVTYRAPYKPDRKAALAGKGGSLCKSAALRSGLYGAL